MRARVARVALPGARHPRMDANRTGWCAHLEARVSARLLAARGLRRYVIAVDGRIYGRSLVRALASTLNIFVVCVDLYYIMSFEVVVVAVCAGVRALRHESRCDNVD